ncbi:hypothetical protein Taro_056194 [Colocasia esculenta]|uniref:Uncharacterized protein n=1 Tax=Colocasia esculenta TaxID=4460 RepID=A0A843XVL1_COLES|nr:hypothetical protein [Colocasia esculenta]
MRIFIRPGVGTTREAPIPNRYFDPVSKWSHSEISGAAPKFLPGSAVADCRCHRIRTPLRSNGNNFSLGDKMSFRGQKTFFSHSEIAILADDLPYSKVFWQ